MTGPRSGELGVVARLRPRFGGHRIGTTWYRRVAESRARNLVPVLQVVTHERFAPPLAHDHGWRLRSTEPLPGKRGDLLGAPAGGAAGALTCPLRCMKSYPPTVTWADLQRSWQPRVGGGCQCQRFKLRRRESFAAV